jgi:hypothetical protein
MQWHPVSARINLPAPWYFTVAELAHEWGCHPERVFYYMDSGQLVPSALIPKWRLPAELQQGVAPNICFTLEDYRSLQWMHASEDAETWLAGEFLAFYVDRGGFRNLRLQVTDPIRITRRDLVVLLEQKETIEESGAQKRSGAINKAERRTLLYIIRALAMACLREGPPAAVFDRGQGVHECWPARYQLESGNRRAEAQGRGCAYRRSGAVAET